MSNCSSFPPAPRRLGQFRFYNTTRTDPRTWTQSPRITPPTACAMPACRGPIPGRRRSRRSRSRCAAWGPSQGAMSSRPGRPGWWRLRSCSSISGLSPVLFSPTRVVRVGRPSPPWPSATQFFCWWIQTPQRPSATAHSSATGSCVCTRQLSHRPYACTRTLEYGSNSHLGPKSFPPYDTAGARALPWGKRPLPLRSPRTSERPSGDRMQLTCDLRPLFRDLLHLLRG